MQASTPVELACHGAPHLHTLYIGNVPSSSEVQPVGLVQLGAWVVEKQVLGMVNDERLRGG